MSKQRKEEDIFENMKNVTLSIVFLDIINSTKFVQKHGAQKSAAWFQVHDRLARSLIYKHQGREIDRSDGFMLSFNNLGNAISFALAYQEIIPKKTPFNSRIGIHWADVIEVVQDDKYTVVGAKRVELEGLGKATTARCMSICQAKQVLMTKDAYIKFKSLPNISNYITKKTRAALVGLYRFKGIKDPQAIYAIGNTIESLQPPPSSNKVKRLGGAKKIKSHARDRKLKEWFDWFIYKIAIVEIVAISYFAVKISSNFHSNSLFYDFTGIDLNYYLWWIQTITKYIS